MLSTLLLFSTLSLASGEPLSSEIKNWCTDLSRDLKSVKLDRCLSKDWKIAGSSVKNKPIPYLNWGDPQGRRILLIGSVHGDEITSVSLVFRWLETLEMIPKDSPLRKQYYLLAPLLNPDGYYIRPRTRVNANGVDLNRNFQSKRWDKDAHVFWKLKSRLDPRRNPGPKSGSEPETLIVQKFIEDFNPALIVSVHAPYGLIDFDGPACFPENIRSPLKVKALGAFPGSLGQYAGVEKKIPVITVELADHKMMPSQKVIDDLMDYVLRTK